MKAAAVLKGFQGAMTFRELQIESGLVIT